jgi:hypothetical protein
MPDFLSLKIEALRQHSLDVPWVSERHATFNHMDMVHRVWYESNVYLFLLLYERFLIFFVCPLTSFALWFHLCYMWFAAHSHASSYATWVRLWLCGSNGPEDDSWHPVLCEI